MGALRQECQSARCRRNGQNAVGCGQCKTRFLVPVSHDLILDPGQDNYPAMIAASSGLCWS